MGKSDHTDLLAAVYECIFTHRSDEVQLIHFVYYTGMSEEAIMELNLPTGIPILYELDENLKPIKPMQFLGDEETVRKAMEAVAAQGKAKK